MQGLHAPSLFVLRRYASLSSASSSLRVPLRYTVHLPSFEKPAHLLAFVRHGDAVSFHASMVRYREEHHRFPALWTEVLDLVDHNYSTVCVDRPSEIDIEELSVSQVARLLRQNTLSCVAIRSIQRIRARRYAMTYDFADADLETDVSNKVVEMECMFYMS